MIQDFSTLHYTNHLSRFQTTDRRVFALLWAMELIYSNFRRVIDTAFTETLVHDIIAYFVLEQDDLFNNTTGSNTKTATYNTCPMAKV